MKKEEKKLYNVTETSKLLGIGKNKVYQLINGGYLSALDLGGLKVPSYEIDRFVTEHIGCSFKDMKNIRRIQTVLN